MADILLLKKLLVFQRNEDSLSASEPAEETDHKAKQQHTASLVTHHFSTPFSQYGDMSLHILR
jgi:hypothetical protein